MLDKDDFNFCVEKLTPIFNKYAKKVKIIDGGPVMKGYEHIRVNLYGIKGVDFGGDEKISVNISVEYALDNGITVNPPVSIEMDGVYLDNVTDLNKFMKILDDIDKDTKHVHLE